MELVKPGLGLIVWMTITFSIVLFILTKFAWKPILAAIKEREDAVTEYKKNQVAKAQVSAVNTGKNIRADFTAEDLKAKMYSYNTNDRSFAIRERLKQIGL
jgi:F0F1-type ATP synthase membrane subunit b/b'